MVERVSVGFSAQVDKFLLGDCISDGKLMITEISFPSPAAEEPIEEADRAGRRHPLQVILVHLLLIYYKIEEVVFKQDTPTYTDRYLATLANI